MQADRRFNWTDEQEILAQVADIAFARIIVSTPDGLRVGHAPVIVTDSKRLRFHLSNHNALCAHLGQCKALILVEGPNAYISANWYADARGSVPTWNYVAIECEGSITQLDQETLAPMLDTLADHMEPKVKQDWTRAKMEPARFDAMCKAITPFEMEIVTLRGTRKLSQNRSHSDLQRVTVALHALGHTEIADQMQGMQQ